MSIFFLACALIFTALAQTCYKLYSLKRRRVYIVATILLFVLTPVMSYLALRELSLSVVYMSTGLTYILVLLAARFVLHERIAGRQLTAVSLIALGVVVFNLQ